MIEALETGGADDALTIQDVYELATRGRVTDVDAALACFSAASRLRDVRAIALRASRSLITGDVASGIALLRRAANHSRDPDRQYLVDLMIPHLSDAGHKREAEEWLESPTDEAVPELIAARDASRAIFAARRGDDAVSIALVDGALSAARAMDNASIKARILQRAGLAAFYRGALDEAQQRAIEAVRAYEEIGAHRYACQSYSLLYVIAHEHAGDPDIARLYAERMTMSAERAGDVTLQNYGLISQLEIAAQTADHRRLGSIRARLLAAPQSEQYRERTQFIVSEALLAIWAKRFAQAHAMLASALATPGRSLPEKSVLEAMLALLELALDDPEAKRRAHRLISQTAHHSDPEPLYEARARRVARVLAACTCILAGESTRGRRALTRFFDPEQAFVALADGPLAENVVPPLLRGYAAAINRVREAVKPAGDAAGLTPAERRVLVALGEDGSIDQIARGFGISRNTVAKHVKAIYDKLDVSSRTQAVRRARDLKLLG